jgi:hypothetical protein
MVSPKAFIVASGRSQYNGVVQEEKRNFCVHASSASLIWLNIEQGSLHNHWCLNVKRRFSIPFALHNDRNSSTVAGANPLLSGELKIEFDIALMK